MLISRVAYRFAKALLEFAVERSELEIVLQDMKVVISSLDENRELQAMLESPVIKVDKKQNIFKQIYGNSLGEVSMKFFDIVFRRNREELINDMAKSFITQYKEFKNIHTVIVETAVVLSDENRKSVLEFLKKRTSDEVELIEKVNEGLIGGVILRMNDLQIDASVKNTLNKLDKKFSKDLYSVKL